MANMLNLVVFEGFLGGDAETKQLTSGRVVTNYRIANTRRYKKGDGNFEDQTTWVNVTDWTPGTQQIAKYLTKGRNIKVVGRLNTRNYQDANGNNRSVTEVIADQVLLGVEKGSGEGSAEAEVKAKVASASQEYDWAAEEDGDEAQPW